MNSLVTSVVLSPHKRDTVDNRKRPQEGNMLIAAYMLVFCAVLYAAFTVFRIIAFCFGYIRKNVNDGSIGNGRGKVEEGKALGIAQRGILKRILIRTLRLVKLVVIFLIATPIIFLVIKLIAIY